MAIRSPEISSTWIHQARRDPSLSGLYCPNAGRAVGRGRDQPRPSQPCPGPRTSRAVVRGRAATARTAASTCWRPRAAARPARRCRSARTRRRSGPAGRGPPRPAASAGRPRRSLAARVARARCSALFTDATVVSSSSATSAACQRSTSRRISTARWRGGRCCSAATNASRIVSWATASSAGSPSAGTAPRRASAGSRSPPGSVASGSVLAAPAADRSIGRARRLRPRSMSRHTLVAIRYSQERSDERPSNRSNACQARTIVSCTASSASNADPSIR